MVVSYPVLAAAGLLTLGLACSVIEWRERFASFECFAKGGYLLGALALTVTFVMLYVNWWRGAI